MATIPKPPKKPKKPLTAYMRYFMRVREQVRNANPSAGITDQAKIVGAMWKQLTEDEKAVYVREYDAENAEYQKIMTDYYESGDYKEWKKKKKEAERMSASAAPYNANNRLHGSNSSSYSSGGSGGGGAGVSAQTYTPPNPYTTLAPGMTIPSMALPYHTIAGMAQMPLAGGMQQLMMMQNPNTMTQMSASQNLGQIAAQNMSTLYQQGAVVPGNGQGVSTQAGVVSTGQTHTQAHTATMATATASPATSTSTAATPNNNDYLQQNQRISL